MRTYTPSEARSIDSVAEREIKLMVNNLHVERNESSSCSDSGSRVHNIPSMNDFLIVCLNPMQLLVAVISTLSEIGRYKSQHNPTVDVQSF